MFQSRSPSWGLFYRCNNCVKRRWVFVINQHSNVVDLLQLRYRVTSCLAAVDDYDHLQSSLCGLRSSVNNWILWNFHMEIRVEVKWKAWEECGRVCATMAKEIILSIKLLNHSRAIRWIKALDPQNWYSPWTDVDVGDDEEDALGLYANEYDQLL